MTATPDRKPADDDDDAERPDRRPDRDRPAHPITEPPTRPGAHPEHPITDPPQAEPKEA